MRDQTTGVGFPLGTIDQYGATLDTVGGQGPTLDNLNALKQYGATQGYPYPMGELLEPDAISQWYQAVIGLSMGQQPVVR